MNDHHHHRARKKVFSAERERRNRERKKRETIVILSSSRDVIRTVERRTKGKQKSTFPPGKIRLLRDTKREEKRTNTKTPSQHTTHKTYPGLWHFRRDQRRLFFLLLFLSYFRLARHLYVCPLNTYEFSAEEKREEQRTCLNPNSLQNPKHFFVREAFLIFKNPSRRRQNSSRFIHHN